MSGTLRNDCFALPPGVDWTPVNEALDRLTKALDTVAQVETVPILDALGRVLAENVVALRSHPAHRNSAVDGYAVAFEDDARRFDLLDGVAAAGRPFEGDLQTGSAVRIFTGAKVPEGTDAVILQEEAKEADRVVSIDAPAKQGANIRSIGEDTLAGDVVLSKGTRLSERGQALAISTGVARVACFKPLTVGVLSTGDELAMTGSSTEDYQVFDANRPMLRAVLQRWGYTVRDLGQVSDDANHVEALLRDAIQTCDAILTSGGASAGDEDHISSVLGQFADRHTWRIAVKPGRPLALANWDGVPIFGLPGNPIAAYVCTLIFARPALRILQGLTVRAPQGFDLPAGFSKSKKHGRSEYPRARVTGAGKVELFRSEGSGRVSGLEWADGLVELPHQGMDIAEGDLVHYIPFTSFD
ncbi:MAG: gephyrin-like molybdotransferase Glp [Pseudomonadota bacterium]